MTGSPQTEQPKRIQRKRTKGWRMPEGAAYVGRPSKWGNPFITHEHTARCVSDEETCPIWRSEPAAYDYYRASRAGCVAAFRHLFQFPVSGDPEYPDTDLVRAELAGRDLACWCPLHQPCHADVLLEIANGGSDDR